MIKKINDYQVLRKYKLFFILKVIN